MKHVFYNNLKVCFCGQCRNDNMQNIQVKNGVDLLVVTIKWLEGDYEKDICLTSNDQDELFQLFADQFVRMEAAGGIVKNNHHSYLFIKRFGIWDLPKGKVEAGESIAQAAIREVTEETGINQLMVGEAMPDTYHLYPTKSKMILKCTHWFHLTTPSTSRPVPQLTEQITEAHWLSLAESKQAMSHTYRSLREGIGIFLEQV